MDYTGSDSPKLAVCMVSDLQHADVSQNQPSGEHTRTCTDFATCMHHGAAKRESDVVGEPSWLKPPGTTTRRRQAEQNECRATLDT
jgi:hypothetical protein